MPPRVRTRRPSRARIPVITAFLLAGALFGSCGDDTVGDRDPETRARLERATYLTENTDDGEATLEDGEFRAPVAPSSASMLVIRLGTWTAGDLDGRGDSDAAAITIEDPGGSGTFFYLHALVSDDDVLRDDGFAFLGDRIRVEGVSVHDGVITVAQFDRLPDAPFSEPPSVPVIRQFRLRDGELTELAAPGGASETP